MSRLLRLPLLLLTLLFTTQVQAACWQWSKTTSANATADPSINWSVGMAPSAVDASGRAMMARLAECRDDVSGALITTGTDTAYALTTNQGTIPSPPTTGQMVAFTAHATNGAALTLAVDGGTAYPVVTSPGSPVASGTLILGSPYSVKFSGTEWVLRDFFINPYQIPLGGIMPYLGSTAPNSNFAVPYGQCISRAVYASLFAMISTTFGACDGVNNFALPDLRGRVIAAVDGLGGGSPAGRLTTTYFGTDPTVLGNVGGSQSHAQTIAEMAAHNHGGATSSVTAQMQLSGLSAATSIQATNNTSLNGGATIIQLSSQAGASAISNLPHDHAITSQGGGAAAPTIPPTMVLGMILRIL